MRRFVFAIALLPIVPAVSLIGVVLLFEFGPGVLTRGSWDEVRWMHLLFAVLWTAGTIIIWRHFVLWTLGRKWLTALVAVVPFIQVIWAQPLWSPRGCISVLTAEVLRHGQHDFLCGLFVWLCIWIWWIGERRAMRKSNVSDKGQRTMSPVAWRLVAGLGSIPVVVGVFAICVTFGSDVLNWNSTSFGYACAGFVAVVLWLVIWRSRVHWSSGVMVQTLGILGVTFLLPILWCWYAEHLVMLGDPWRVISYAIPIIGYGLWMIWTARVWPIKGDVAGGGRSVPHCPACDYPLIGLTGTRCPECGNEPTLEALWQQQAGV